MLSYEKIGTEVLVARIVATERPPLWYEYDCRSCEAATSRLGRKVPAVVLLCIVGELGNDIETRLKRQNEENVCA